MNHPSPVSPLQALRKDWFFWTLLLLLVGLTAVAPAKVSGYPALVDWPTIATLAGLLVLTKGVELSGYLHHLGERLLVLMPTERALALFLVLATALLSMLLTNDVALFVVVPLTVSLRIAVAAPLPITRLIIFEALAANAGSALTPIGNPQNLFLWQQSQLPFHSFVVALLPLFLLLMVPLLVLSAAAFSSRALQIHQLVALPPVRRHLLWLSLALYLPFLILTELHHAPAALLVLLAIFLLGFRKVLARVDWGLILVFVLMFIDLRLLAQLDLVRDVIGNIGLAQPQRLYLAGIAASQLISNVPAAILLAEYTRDWRLTAYAVNVGGFGFMLGSLANIIALRMTHQRSAWLVFHLYSLPFLLVTGGLVYLWLFVW
ncbi:SLC13 family permease [Undibacterium arcticum]|uniref:SLC13 family permease n=1 Tax=Undibacterium arcticum TaxID=1762892 RepID=A0ABV7EWU3_9BURK